MRIKNWHMFNESKQFKLKLGYSNLGKAREKFNNILKEYPEDVLSIDDSMIQDGDYTFFLVSTDDFKVRQEIMRKFDNELFIKYDII